MTVDLYTDISVCKLFYSYSKPILVSEMSITIFCVTVIKLNIIFKMISEKWGAIAPLAPPVLPPLWVYMSIHGYT